MNRSYWTGAALLTFVALYAQTGWGQAAAVHARFGVTYTTEDYARVLSTYVDEKGMVDYTSLKANREPLDNHVRDVAGLYTEIYEEWPQNERMAYLINAYNALTLETIIDHYPIEKNWKQLWHPIGIRHIPDAWTESRHMLKGDMLSLDQIEHDLLRKQFKEPRIHMALVCAAKSCPPLRREPYEARRLNDQLDDQARTFLADPSNFRIDKGKQKTVYLSEIFEWFGKDFVEPYRDKPTVNWGTEEEQAVLAFILEFLNDDDRNELLKNTYSIDYIKYDWSLNDQ